MQMMPTIFKLSEAKREFDVVNCIKVTGKSEGGLQA